MPEIMAIPEESRIVQEDARSVQEESRIVQEEIRTVREEGSTTPEVRILPEIIANKIAAGEVVERPASVVKELIENSLDAGAKRITIEIEKGGSDLIRVSDDGHGMSRENALLSIQRYGTSKIVSDNDLFSIKTFGFRGEALPSMASVSNFTLITRENGATSGTQIGSTYSIKDSSISDTEGSSISGTKIDISGGNLLDVSETGAPSGTMIEVRNLYFNTPARRKFLKTVNTEMGHIATAVAGFALAAPHVQFRLVHNGRVVKHYSDSDDLLSRVGMVLGTENADDLYAVDSTERISSTDCDDTKNISNNVKDITKERGLYITGYITKPSISRSSSGNILLFVNQRMISDRALVSAILRGYKGRMMKGQFPMAALFINIPFDEVDVNVHPAKLQVRFANQSLVFGAVTNAVHNSLYHGEKKEHSLTSSHYNKSENHNRNEHDNNNEHYNKNKEIFSETCDQEIAKENKAIAEENKETISIPITNQEPFELKKQYKFQNDIHNDISEINEYLHDLDKTDIELTSTFVQPVSSIPLDFEHSELPTNSIFPKHPDILPKNIDILSKYLDTFPKHPTAYPENSKKTDGLRIIGQFANAYIVAESIDEMEMVLIDQHAAHERIVYEKLKKRSQGFRPPSQNMIVPEIVEFNYKEAALLEKIMPELLNMGIEIENFGGRSFVVKSIPAIIDDKSIKPMLMDMIGMAEESLSETDTGAWLDRILILMACHSAVRANHALNQKEMEQLVSDLEKCENPYHCPHGRPTIISFKEKELEKRFKRIGN
ncbi:MAG: DNA mismatch repair endonuclease MutL [Desulfamplus sp.]|nr:DNA mismatch repair endonuclease MutL [Desulfamplus sp.]